MKEWPDWEPSSLAIHVTVKSLSALPLLPVATKTRGVRFPRGTARRGSGYRFAPDCFVPYSVPELLQDRMSRKISTGIRKWQRSCTLIQPEMRPTYACQERKKNKQWWLWVWFRRSTREMHRCKNDQLCCNEHWRVGECLQYVCMETNHTRGQKALMLQDYCSLWSVRGAVLNQSARSHPCVTVCVTVCHTLSKALKSIFSFM